VSGQLHAPVTLAPRNGFRYSSNRRLSGHHIQSGDNGGKGSLLHLPEIERRILGCAARRLIAVPSSRRITGEDEKC
jgi:hypothetical protein